MQQAIVDAVAEGPMTLPGIIQAVKKSIPGQVIYDSRVKAAADKLAREGTIIRRFKPPTYFPINEDDGPTQGALLDTQPEEKRHRDADHNGIGS